MSEADNAEREARLPKWAQEELRKLRRDLAAEREQVAELKGGKPDSNTYWVTSHEAVAPLPRDARVGFRLVENGVPYQGRVLAHVEEGKLVVRGASPLIIRPESSSAFSVEFSE
ncbi:hypothetical protein ADL22_12650 [Streptomyces sp. NRRL F-4489]|uniref:DUF7239 family protein n=1 Tax=Streptomyces sp. NRRL F-4489 TaxID=1609095 RepID=UPI000746252C|nr:hypothetical protein [Streptomyces sp. NRRL F-4489]KUL44786.1 hypothetical protein ADL22_12650 [Streptomyces sp. NRRL F-4489]